jgi:RNA polymerase sigma-70 factor (ECF subfamily)
MVFAWEDFVSRHAQAVLNSALRVIGNVADAEDVAQEVFLEVFRTRKMGEMSEQPALMRTLATRRALDRLRRRKVTQELDAVTMESREHESSEYAIAAELDQRLRKDLAKLPSREAEVFCLRVLEGNTISETAALLCISEGAVAKALSMARKRLAASFGDARTEIK